MAPCERDFRRNAAICVTRLLADTVCDDVIPKELWAPAPPRVTVPLVVRSVPRDLNPSDSEESVVEYICRIYTRSHMEDQVLAAHCVQVGNFVERHGEKLSASAAKCLLAVSLHITAKVVADRTFGNHAMARLASMRVGEFNRLEAWFLEATEWDVLPDAEETRAVMASLTRRSPRTSPKCLSLRGSDCSSSTGAAGTSPPMPRFETRYVANGIHVLRLVNDVSSPKQPSEVAAMAGGSSVRVVRFLRRVFA